MSGQNQPTELNTGDLHTLWAALDRLEEAADRASHYRHQTMAFTARSFDEAQPAGPRTYIAAHSFLEVARQNIDAFKVLTQGDYGVRQWPHWNLLRPVLEASFWTVWILEPDDGRERRRRGLRAEIDDAREQEKWLREILPIVDEEDIAQALANISKSNTTFRREAEQLGMTWGQAREPVAVTRELGRLQVFQNWDEDMGPIFASVWRRLSGAQHGKVWSLLLGSEKNVVAQIPGGSVVHVTTRDEDFVTQVKTVGLLYLAALQLWINRNTTQ